MAKIKLEVQIYDILDLIKDNNYDFTGSYGEDNSVTIWTNQQFQNAIEYFYAERSFLCPATLEGNRESQEVYFRGLFTLYKTQMSTSLARAIVALEAEYNPLDNYNGKETSTTVHGKKDTTTFNTTDTLTNGHTITETSGVYGFNSATAKPDGENVIANSGDDVTAKKGTVDVAASGTDTVTIEKAGNLGVTTSQQMIESELNLRRINFVNRCISDFINTYTVY